MASTESLYLTELYQDWSSRMAANPEMDIASLRDLFEEWHLAAIEPEDVSYQEVDADGVPSLWCIPKESSAHHAVFYTHGGGFAVASRHTHRKLAGHLAKAIGCRALVIDYRRSPEHPYPAQLEDSVTAFRWLVGQGISANRIATCGDSAGGNLAISTVLKLRADGDDLPAAAMPISPWFDMELKGATLDSNADTDVLVQRPILEGMVSMFLGAADAAVDPLANPLLADLHGLPPVFVSVGTAETLLDDSQRLVERASAAGVDINLHTAVDQQHVFPMLAGRAPEADETISAMASWVRPKLGLG